MEKLHDANGTRKTRITCSPLYCGFVYCMMLNRISRGYTTDELTFLVGQDDHFISDIESLTATDFSMDLYGSLRQVFQHPNFLLHEGHVREEMEHEMHSWQDEMAIYHRMDRYVNERETVTIFQLVEEHPQYSDQFTNSVSMEVEGCREVLRLLIEEGLFNKPIPPNDLHNHVESILQMRIKPRYLQAELDKLWGRKGKAPLKRTKRRSYGYKYGLHPGVSITDAITFTKQQFNTL
ncbi:hypothetical protein FXV77_07735 [Sphingobacterium phlebotomi]|uniref:Uncharacterized protein n=1 Tax=Sphingobacterium phlebotomi TaxID=2605433 RepID=A0A5D4HC00_9SPHI|nr:hypothetical protein [Sphingobacterium phlebotomi]TYR37055.1 hypothetical protein FXV77_07735 [Sphingobacterium phlebotomi]HLT86617.1 hypothetical protein [Sphingobacterium sp.]